MGCHDRRQIFTRLRFARRLLPNRCGRRVCIGRCGRGTLNARIHVCAIVVTYIHHIMSPLHRTGQRLKADVIRSAVAAKRNKFIIFFQTSRLFQVIVRCLHTTQSGPRIFKRIVNIAVLIRGVRICERGNLKTSRGISDDCLIFRVKRLQYISYRNRRTAAGTKTVAGSKSLLPRLNFLKIKFLFHLSPSSHAVRYNGIFYLSVHVPPPPQALHTRQRHGLPSGHAPITHTHN